MLELIHFPHSTFQPILMMFSNSVKCYNEPKLQMDNVAQIGLGNTLYPSWNKTDNTY